MLSKFLLAILGFFTASSLIANGSPLSSQHNDQSLSPSSSSSLSGVMDVDSKQQQHQTCDLLLKQFLRLHKLEEAYLANTKLSSQDHPTHVNQNIDECVLYLTNLIMQMSEFYGLPEFDESETPANEEDPAAIGDLAVSSGGGDVFLPARETRRVKSVKKFWKRGRVGGVAHRKFW